MQATHKRITAHWHLDYSLLPNGQAHINRIWRDDEKKFIINTDCWRAIEERGREVIGLVIGKSENGISPNKNIHEFKVSNPQFIFDYK